MNMFSNSLKLRVLSDQRKNELDKSLEDLEERVLQIASAKVQTEAEAKLKIAKLKRERSFANEILAKTQTVLAEIDREIADVDIAADIIQIKKKMPTPRAIKKEPKPKKPKRSEAEAVDSDEENLTFYQRRRSAKEIPSSSTVHVVVKSERASPTTARRPSTSTTPNEIRREGEERGAGDDRRADGRDGDDRRAEGREGDDRRAERREGEERRVERREETRRRRFVIPVDEDTLDLDYSSDIISIN